MIHSDTNPILRHLLIFCCISLANICRGVVLVRDTVTELPEVSIEAESQKMDVSSFTYYPDSKTKKFSIDAVDLLQRMGITQLIVNPIQNSVTTTMGDGVAIFINHVRANQYDLNGLKCTDVLKVEYLDYPSDPRFEGADHVVNIVTKIYLSGGYTKLTGTYKAGDFQNPDGNIFSKFSYRKTTIDAYLGGTYFNSRNMSSEETQSYNLPTGVIERETISESGRKERYAIPVSLRMTHAISSMTIENNLSYSFNNVRTSSSSGSLFFVPAIDAAAYTYTSSTPAIYRSVEWTGRYSFFLPKGWFLRISPYFRHTHNNTSSGYRTDVSGMLPIINDAKENANVGRISAFIDRDFSKVHSLSLNLVGEMMKTRVGYYGSTPDVINFSDNWARAELIYSARLTNRIRINANLDIQCNRYTTNQYKETVLSPTILLNAFIMGKHSNQWSVSANYGVMTPVQVMRSTNVLQDNELMYFTGNPYLDKSQYLNLGTGYSQTLSDRYSYSINVRYSSQFDPVRDRYCLYDNDRAIIRTYWNNGNFHTLSLSANLSGRFFSNRMMIQVTPQLTHYRLSGECPLTHTPVACNFYAQYYINRFSIGAWYCVSAPVFSSQSGAYTTSPDYYGLQATCTLGSWNLKLFATNFLSTRKRDSRSVMQSPLYSYISESYSGAYRPVAGLTAVFTFGYGKKVNDRSELTAPGENPSLILTK